MNKQKQTNLIIIGLISLGIVIGIVISWIFIFFSINSTINNILPNLQIENLNLNFNETALVEAMNKTFSSY